MSHASADSEVSIGKDEITCAVWVLAGGQSAPRGPDRGFACWHAARRAGPLRCRSGTPPPRSGPPIAASEHQNPFRNGKTRSGTPRVPERVLAIPERRAAVPGTPPPIPDRPAFRHGRNPCQNAQKPSRNAKSRSGTPAVPKRPKAVPERQPSRNARKPFRNAARSETCPGVLKRAVF
jgi:hypothetical protein